MRGSRTAAGVVLALLLAIGTSAGDWAGAATEAPGSGDITALITANGGRNDIVLNGGDYTITIPSTGPIVQEEPDLPPLPETIYHGVISGTGTVTVRPPAGGRATLVMTNTNTWSLPISRLRSWTNQQPFATYQYDGVTLNGGKSPWDVHVLHGDTNDPALTIAKGAVVNFSDLDGPRAILESTLERGGKTGLGTYNLDTVRVDGTLVFTNNHYGSYNTTIPTLTGTGDFINHHGGFRMSGINTISGHVLISGANINGGWARGELPNTASIYNGQDLAYGATPKTIAPAGQSEASPGVQVISQTLYECCYGNAFYNIGAGELRLTGKYSFTDTTDQLNPSLSNPKLNYVAMPKGDSHRILDLGGITTFGDGTDADFWLPSGWGNTYIATRNAYAIGFDYNGTVRMNTPINRPEEINGANLFVRGTKGNHVIVTQRLLYHGFTKVDRNAVLQFGDGTIGNKNPNFSYTNVKRGWTITGTYSTSSGNGSLLTADVPMGAAGDRIINDGTLVIANVAKGAYSGVGPLSLSDISGRGALQQQGPAPLTLLSHITYTGATKVSGGTLVLSSSKRGPASLSSSSGVQLTGKKARLDISPSGAQTLKGLSGVAGSQILLGGRRLSVNSAASTVFAGTITDGGIHPGSGGGVDKTGAGRLTLTGAVTTSGPVRIRGGNLELRGSSTHRVNVAGPVTVAKQGQVSTGRAQVGSLSSSGRTTLRGPLIARAGFTQSATGVLDVAPAAGTSAFPSLTTGGAVSLAGTLRMSGAPAAGRYTLINNQGKNAVHGTFNGVPEGGTFKAGDTTVTVSYRGGDGNDVVLSTTAASAAGAAPANLGSHMLSEFSTTGGGHAALAGGVLLVAGLLLVFFLYHRRTADRAAGRAALTGTAAVTAKDDDDLPPGLRPRSRRSRRARTARPRWLPGR